MAKQVAASRAWQPDEALVVGPSLLSSMWERRYLLVASAIAGFLIGYALSSTQPPEYRATANVFLTDPADANLFGRDTADPERHVQQEAGRMQSRTVFERAAEIAGDDVVGRVGGAVDITADTQVGVINVSSTAGSPKAAASLANAVVAAYEQISREAGTEVFNTARDVLNAQMTELQDQADELQNQLNDNPDDAAASSTLQAVQAQLTALRTRLSEIATEVAIYGAGIDGVEEARPPVGRSSPKPLRDGVFAALLGVALASAYAYWRASTAQEGRADVSELLDAPLLAEIPDFPYAGDDDSMLVLDATAIEAYQFLVSSVEHGLSDTGDRSILVTSTMPGEGKSLTALHLARALATQGRDVVLVDASLRGRDLTTRLRADEDAGMAELAAGSALREVERAYRVSDDVRLAFVAAGHPPQPRTGLLSTSGYRTAIEKIIAAHELTVIDGDSLLTVADTTTIARQVSGIILVVDAGTSHEELTQVRERLRFISTPLIGYVANRTERRVNSAHRQPQMHNRSGGQLGSSNIADEGVVQHGREEDDRVSAWAQRTSTRRPGRHGSP